MESVDARLGELLEELATYRLKLDTQLTVRYKEFERSIFQLMLYDKQLYVVSESGTMRAFEVMDTLEATALLPGSSIVVPSYL